MKWDLKHEKNYLILLLFWTFIILNISWELFVSQRKEARLEEQWKEQRVPGITIEKGKQLKRGVECGTPPIVPVALQKEHKQMM